MNPPEPCVIIIGAGPAGLMAAEALSEADVAVHLYDAMPSAGRKFLMAGKGGMNITHAESLNVFLSRYGQRQDQLETIIRDFPPADVRAWIECLGFDTFVGSSGRVFPTDMKAAPLLRAWLHRLRAAGVQFHMRHRWLGFDDTLVARFDTANGEISVKADAIVLALGGGSWPQLGSTGAWCRILAQHGIDIAPLRPANCGFELAWSEHVRQRFAGQPLKSVALALEGIDGRRHQQRGELMITDYGLEGGLIYALSAPLREAIAGNSHVDIALDLLPDMALPTVVERLSQPRGKATVGNILRKRLHLDGVKTALLYEPPQRPDLNDCRTLAARIKALPFRLTGVRPIEEAISSAGGIGFDQLDAGLMLKPLPGVFCAGEMLDWEAPTGGYLLTACLATGRAAGKGVAAWLSASHLKFGSK